MSELNSVNVNNQNFKVDIEPNVQTNNNVGSSQTDRLPDILANSGSKQDDKKITVSLLQGVLVGLGISAGTIQSKLNSLIGAGKAGADAIKDIVNLSNTHAGKIVQEWDAADGEKDGYISADVWNEHMQEYGGQKIKNKISVVDAMNSITTYIVRLANSIANKTE